MTDAELEQLADLLDQAMTSDNPTVKRAFKNLLMVAAIDSSDAQQAGPIRELLNRMKRLETRINNIENQWVRPQQPSPWTPGTPMGPVPLEPYVSPNTQLYTWPTPSTGSPPPNQIWCSSQGASSTAFDDQFLKEHS